MRDSIDLFAEKTFSPKQAELFEWYFSQRDQKRSGSDEYEHILASAWGRRTGKSDGHSALFAKILVDELCDVADQIKAGTRRAWTGIGKTRSRQKKERPHFLAFVVGPSTRDLVDVCGHILSAFAGAGRMYLHPDEHMQLADNGSRIFFLYEGACASVSLIPAKHASAMVGRGPQLVYITESGFVPSSHWDRLLPSFWDLRTWVLTEGTPVQDPMHWFTKLLVSGLDDDHDEADRQIADRNRRVHTTRANTIDHAFLPSAREAARQEKAFRGERWAALWIEASWSSGSDAVFDRWDPYLSVKPVKSFPYWSVNQRRLARPDSIEIYVDWHNGGAPGAAVCVAIWRRRNPLDPKDPRPFMIQIDEHMDDEERLEYTRDGWWQIIKSMRDKHGARKIYGDPTGSKLMRQARRHGLRIKPAENAEKQIRLELLNSLFHAPERGGPAFYLAENCPKTAKCLDTYHYVRNKVTGELTDKPSQYNDHLTDCLAYAAGHHARGGGVSL